MCREEFVESSKKVEMRTVIGRTDFKEPHSPKLSRREARCHVAGIPGRDSYTARPDKK